MHPFSRWVLLWILCAISADASALKPDTLAAWEQHLARIDPATANAPAGQSFLLLDRDPSLLRQVLRDRKVVVFPAKEDGAISVPHGLIHDWIGEVFVPAVTLVDFFAATRDYEKYSQWYRPTIIGAHLIQRTDNNDRFSVRYLRHVLFVTAVLEADYDTRYVQVSATQWYSIATSTGMQEIDQYGKPDEHKLPPDDGSGYIWRVYTLTRYEQRDNGVYVEQESVALSRPIPTSLRMIVVPVVRRLAKDLLGKSLTQTRDALLSQRKQK